MLPSALSFTAARKLQGAAAFLTELARLPHWWRAQLQRQPLFQLLDGSVETARPSRPIALPASWIVPLIRARVRLSRSWRRNRCLLAGLLLYDLLPRAGYSVTLHFGCALRQGQLSGHSWVSAPELRNLGRFNNAGNHTAIVTRTRAALTKESPRV